jgi:hypothetical protein
MVTRLKASLVLSACLSSFLLISSPSVLAQEEEAVEGTFVAIEQAEVEQILAPIALYPDILLSQILSATAYPLDIIQAAQWREENSDLSPEEALSQTESKDWPESVQALLPFNDLLQDLSEDLYWLESLGDAYESDPEAVLTGVQALRKVAQEQGSLPDTDHAQVIEEEGEISIASADPDVIYVPYYDTRIVYGRWRHANNPYYWKRPAHYRSRGRFHWSPRYYVRNKVARHYGHGKRHYGTRKFRSYYSGHSHHGKKVRRSYSGNRHFSQGHFSRTSYKKGYNRGYKRGYGKKRYSKRYRHGYKKRYNSYKRRGYKGKRRGYKKRYKRYRRRGRY